jgi:Family of unknown function (DUF5681)
MSETTPPSTPLKRGRAKPWKPGQSGNPAGRPKGARHKTTLAMEALLDGECASDFPPTNSAGPRLWAGFTDARSVNTAVEVERENDPPRTLCDPHHPA